MKNAHEVDLCWLQEESGTDAESSNGEESYGSLRKELWKARVPPKVKMCIWRIAWNILPTRSNLSRRGVVCEHGYLKCAAEVESSYHVFVECPYAIAVWFASLLGLRVNELLLI